VEAVLGVELLIGVENLPHDQRRQAKRRLVEHQEPWPAHQRACDRQHLLLAARQRAAALREALIEPGKQRQHPFEIAIEVARCGHGRAHLQVFQHRHAGKDAAPFRGLRQLQPRDLVGRQPG